MKSKFQFPSSSNLLFSATIALVSSLTWQANAVVYYWDTDPAAGFGTASGTWGTDAFWNTSNVGAGAGTVIPTVLADTVNFGTATTALAAGSVGVVASGVTATSITFGAASGAIALTGSNTITLGAAATITVNNTADSISPVLAGATTSLTKAGTGTLTLSGANTFTGLTKITAGTLSVTNALGLQNSSLDTTNMITGTATAGLQISPTTLTLAGLSGTKDLATVFTTTAGGYSGLTALTLNPGINFSNSYSGAIVDGAAGMTLSKTGSGTQTLSGANTYTGITSISGGTLQFGKVASLYNGVTSNWTAANLSVATGSSASFNVGGTGEFATTDITTLLTNLGGLGGAVSNNGLQAGSFIGLDTTNASGGSFSVTNNITDSTGLGGGAIGLTKFGANTLSLSGSNSYTGITRINAGILKFATPGALYGGNTLNWTPANLTASVGSTLAVNIGGGSDFSDSQINTLLTNLSTVSSNGLRTGSTFGFDTTNAAGDVTYSHVLTDSTGTGGGVVGYAKFGTGTLILDQPNTYTGTTTVANGTLKLTGNRTATQGALTAGNIDGQTGTMEISNGNFSTGTGDISIGLATNSLGVISQTAGTVSTTATANNNGRVLIASGIGTTGTYNLSSGTLNAMGFGTSLNNANGFVLGTNSNSIATFNLSGTGILTTKNDPFSFVQIGRSNSTTTSVSGNFIQTGGTATIYNLGMGGANNTSTTSVLSVTGGTFSVATAFTTMAAGATSTASITIGGTADVTLPAFPITRGASSTATITFDGGTLRPTAASLAYISAMTSATIQDGGAKFDVATGKDIVITQPLLTHPSSLGGGLTKAGLGVLALSGVNTYTGPTAVTAGTLGLNTSSSLDAASAVTVSTGATLTGTGSAAGTLASSGTIAPGTLGVGTLSTGAATLSAGALAIEVSGATADKLVSTGALNLSGATLTVTELVVPGAPTSFVIAEGTSRTGTFVAPTLPPGYSISYNGTQAILNFGATPANYSTWAIDNGIPGQPASGDFDNDGLSNLVEYALNLNPTVSTVPAGTFSGGTLSFTKGSQAFANGDVTYEIEQSTTLTGWTVVVTNNPLLNTISYTLPTGQPKEFARLKITQIP